MHVPFSVGEKMLGASEICERIGRDVQVFQVDCESVAIECAGKIEKFPEPGEKSSLWTFVDPHLGAAVEDDNGVRLDLARLFLLF